MSSGYLSEWALEAKRTERMSKAIASASVLVVALSWGYGAVDHFTATVDEGALRTEFTRKAVAERVLDGQREAIEKQLADHVPGVDEKTFSYNAPSKIDIADIHADVEEKIESRKDSIFNEGLVFAAFFPVLAGLSIYGFKKTWDDHREIKALEQQSAPAP